MTSDLKAKRSGQNDCGSSACSVPGHYVISKERWSKHLKYVRRLERKHRAKCIALEESQKKLMGFNWFMRHALSAVYVMSGRKW